MCALKPEEKPILLSSPTMHGEELEYINEAFERNWIAPLGFNVDAFEQEMSEYLSKRAFECNCLALCSGTAAIHLAVKLAGIGRGNIVLCSDMTFAATVNPVTYEGGIPVFIDSEYDTWNMDPQALEKALKYYDGRDSLHPKAKAVIVAHLYGTPAKIDELLYLCDKYGVIMIEDAAESLSATYGGRQTGTFGKYGAISFNGNKIITTSGGGMLLTDDQSAREKALFWATQARDSAPWYQHSEIGYNYRMSNVVAGIGRGQLIHIEEHRELKEKIYRRYKEGLKGLPITMNPYDSEKSVPNFWLSCMLIERGCNVLPMKIYEALKEQRIETRPIWKPMHLQPVYKSNNFFTVNGGKDDGINVNSDISVSNDIFARGLCLPSDIKMTDCQQSEVIENIRTLFQEV